MVAPFDCKTGPPATGYAVVVMVGTKIRETSGRAVGTSCGANCAVGTIDGAVCTVFPRLTSVGAIASVNCVIAVSILAVAVDILLLT